MQPSTGAVRSGSSPSSRIRLRARSTAGSGSGTAESSAIVYGCCGARKRSSAARDLDELAAVHHDHAVADVADRREVVGDEQVREPELLLQVAQQVQDLRAHGHVERGDRLVADDERGVRRERPRDRDALALTARELERAALAEIGREADEPQQLGHASGRRRRRLPTQQVERLGHDRVDGHHRVERVARVLEDHLDAAAELLREAASAGCLERPSVEGRRTGGLRRQAEEEACDRRLPRAGLAHEADGLAGPDLERDTVDRTEVAPAEPPAAAGAVALRQVCDLDERGHVGGDRPRGGSGRTFPGGSLPRLPLVVAGHAPRPVAEVERRGARCGRAHARSRSGSAPRSGSPAGSHPRAAASRESRRAPCRARRSVAGPRPSAPACTGGPARRTPARWRRTRPGRPRT